MRVGIWYILHGWFFKFNFCAIRHSYICRKSEMIDYKVNKSGERKKKTQKMKFEKKIYLALTNHTNFAVRSMSKYQNERFKTVGGDLQDVAWWLPKRMKNNGEEITKTVLGCAHQGLAHLLFLFAVHFPSSLVYL